MSGYVLDTNVLSELTRDVPNQAVLRFLHQHDDLWLPAIAIYEAEYGLHLLPRGRRRDRLRAAYDAILEQYQERVLPLDWPGAVWAARFQAQETRMARSVNVGDVLIAGTAKAHGFAVATRNVRHFEEFAVDVLNPWDTP